MLAVAPELLGVTALPVATLGGAHLGGSHSSVPPEGLHKERFKVLVRACVQVEPNLIFFCSTSNISATRQYHKKSS